MVPDGGLACAVMLWHQPALAAPGRVFQTEVAPEPGEDLAAPCSYEMTLTDPSRTVKGAWVIFDRGRDMLRYYGDPDVQAFAQRHDLALVVPFHCRATAYEDIDVDPARGIGRALFTALSQFAKSSGHPELSSARVILLGFSGTGALVARFPDTRQTACSPRFPLTRGTSTRSAWIPSTCRRAPLPYRS